MIRRGPRNRRGPQDDGFRVNERIRARQVRVISSNGEQLGVMSPRDAVAVAQEQSLDLVEVSPQANPPVCKILDYGKFKYEQSKREKEARKRQKTINVKELRMRPKIDDHDFEVKAKNARKFLENGDKVKISVRFRGREIVHKDLAREKLQTMASQLNELGGIEHYPKMEGRQMVMVLAPHQS